MRRPRINWLEAKKLYMGKPEMTLKEIAENLSLNYKSLRTHAGQEKWSGQRKALLAVADEEIAKRALQEVVEMKDMHKRLGKVLWARALQALKKDSEGKMNPKSFRDIIAGIVAGTKIERQALGIGEKKQSPASFAISFQQEAIINTYRHEKPSVQEAEVVEDQQLTPNQVKEGEAVEDKHVESGEKEE